MPLWMQHTLVVVMVAGCLAVVLWQGLQTLFGKKARIGNCCARGCGAAEAKGPASEKVIFLPVEMLRKRK